MSDQFPPGFFAAGDMQQLRGQLDAALARVEQLRTALLEVQRRTERALFTRSDMADLDASLWDIRQVVKTALSAGDDDESATP